VVNISYNVVVNTIIVNKQANTYTRLLYKTIVYVFNILKMTSSSK